jgi:predicted Zn finger-like uncharacterized protein
MFVVCRTCSSSYHIPDEILGESPRDFRCSQCGETWRLRPRATLTAPAASTRGAPPRLERASAPRAAPSRRLASLARRLAAPLAAAGVLAGSMILIGEREAIVAAAPLASGAYSAIGLPVNLRGLAIEDVRARLEQSGGKATLVVEGSIANLRQMETAAPPLRIALRGADARELYVWTTRAPKDKLAAHERAHFAARLAAPPEGAKDALVKFVSPGDKIALNMEGS